MLRVVGSGQAGRVVPTRSPIISAPCGVVRSNASRCAPRTAPWCITRSRAYEHPSAGAFAGGPAAAGRFFSGFRVVCCPERFAVDLDRGRGKPDPLSYAGGRGMVGADQGLH